MRPYLEVEVVKVKKKDNSICPECGQPCDMKKKDNWINGENLNKIKFPCFCWYMSMSGRKYCELDVFMVNKYIEKKYYRVKELIQRKDDTDDYSNEFYDYDLGKLIKFLRLHITKAKLILFEEE